MHISFPESLTEKYFFQIYEQLYYSLSFLPFLPLPQAGTEALQPKWSEGGGLLFLAEEALNYGE